MKMFSSICCINVPITKSPILSCLPSQHNNSSSSTENSPPLGSKRKPREAKIPASASPSVQKKPSVAEIERAIGAGIFRDRNTDGDSEESKTLFDTIFSNTIGESEGSVEKKLRETGEWILDKTEGSSSRSADVAHVIILLHREKHFKDCFPIDFTTVDHLLPSSCWFCKTAIRHSIS